MKKLLIGLLAIGTLSAQASMLEVNGPLDATLFEAQVNEEKTHFETLGDLFKAGQRPDLKKISNIAWAGRCFHKEKQNEPTNAIYVFRPKISDTGPIGTNSKAYEALSAYNPLEAPNFFDQMSMEQALALPWAATFLNVRIKANSVEIDFNGSSKSNLKASGNYLVEEITSIKEDVGPVGKRTPFARCYYFIPDLKDYFLTKNSALKNEQFQKNLRHKISGIFVLATW